MNISISSPVVTQSAAVESAVVKKEPATTGAVADVVSSKTVQDTNAVDRTSVLASADNKPKNTDEKALESAVVELNKAVQNVQRNLEFSVDDITGGTVVQVKDRETDEVIRQMPTEDALRMAQNLHEQLSGGGGDFSIMQALKA